MGDFSQLKQDLAEHGVGVVTGVIPPEQCDNYIQQYQQWLKKFGDSYPDTLNAYLQSYTIFHHPVNWEVRIKSKPIFEALWGTEKLMVSFDGASIGEPPEKGRFKFQIPGKYNFHLDTGNERPGLQAYQGAVYLNEQTEEDWCFAVLEDSHKYHAEFVKEFPSSSSSSSFPVNQTGNLPDDVLEWYKKMGCTLKRVAVPKGGMVIWDSRTVHSVASPIEGRQNANQWRHVVFVCMTPAQWANEKDLKEKKFAYENLKGTWHWPSAGIIYFEESQKEPDCVTEMPPVAKTREAKLLAGVVPYDFDDGKPNGPQRPVILELQE